LPTPVSPSGRDRRERECGCIWAGVHGEIENRTSPKCIWGPSSAKAAIVSSNIPIAIPAKLATCIGIRPKPGTAANSSGRIQVRPLSPRTAQASRELRVTSPSSSFSSSLSWVASFLSDDLTAGLSSSFAGRCLGPWAFAPLSASNDAISEMNAT
jgi:hypothetical protein